MRFNRPGPGERARLQSAPTRFVPRKSCLCRAISPCAGSGEPELQRTIAYDNFTERYARLQTAHGCECALTKRAYPFCSAQVLTKLIGSLKKT